MKKRILISMICAGLLLAPAGCGSDDSGQHTDRQENVSDVSNEDSMAQESADEESSSQEASAQANVQGEEPAQDTSQQETVPSRDVEEYDLPTELAKIEERSDALQKKLQEDPTLSQTDLNETAREIYKLWDDELNVIWNRLKGALSVEEMAALTTEEREWVEAKEAEAEAAASEYEGGSMTALVVYQRQAVLTRERVYELAGYLGERNGQKVTMPQTGDDSGSYANTQDYYSGLYVDTYGTDDIYSELELAYIGDGSYQAIIGIYRLTTLEGIATVDGEVLSFEDTGFQVKGEITIEGTGAVFTVTESEFVYMSPGDTYEFPEKR